MTHLRHDRRTKGTSPIYPLMKKEKRGTAVPVTPHHPKTMGFSLSTDLTGPSCSNKIWKLHTEQALKPGRSSWQFQIFLRKEVIQPQVPLRLPCYDFTPVADPTVVACLLAVSTAPSGKTNSHGVTGGVYKARERIHRGILIHDY
jgi:hypothetical protein